MKKTILFFGSEVSGDDTAFKVMELLKGKVKANLVKCESIHDMPDEGEVITVDVVKGIKNVQLFTDIDDFSRVKSVSAHDLDLGTHLKIMKEMDWPLKVKIIGIPFGMKPQEVAPAVEEIIRY